MAGHLAIGLLLSAVFATYPGVPDVPDSYDRTDPYHYWLIGESNDGLESIYLRQMDLGKNADDGSYHAFFVITDEGSRVVDWQYATQFEIEFKCDNRTYAPRGTWHYGPRGDQKNVTLLYQDELIFAPIKPDGPFAIAAKHFCDGMTLNYAQTGEVRVSQLMLYQAAKYAVAAQRNP